MLGLSQHVLRSGSELYLVGTSFDVLFDFFFCSVVSLKRTDEQTTQKTGKIVGLFVSYHGQFSYFLRVRNVARDYNIVDNVQLQ